MIFVDGTNLIHRISNFLNIKSPSSYIEQDLIQLGVQIVERVDFHVQRWSVVVRRHWFGSYQGDDVAFQALREMVHTLGYEPNLFKRRDGKEKGVDVSLTTKMLVNAVQHNYDAVLLVAGDEDYVELVREVKRLGRVVWVAFLPGYISSELRLASDNFFPFEDSVLKEVCTDERTQRIAQKLRTATHTGN